MDLNQKTILIPMIGQLRSLKTTTKIFPSKGDILLDYNQDYIGLTETNLPEWHCLETGEVLVLKNFVCDT